MISDGLQGGNAGQRPYRPPSQAEWVMQNLPFPRAHPIDEGRAERGGKVARSRRQQARQLCESDRRRDDEDATTPVLDPTARDALRPFGRMRDISNSVEAVLYPRAAP